MFQVLIVGGNHAPRVVLPELLQHRFGNGTAYLGLGAGAELVYQQKRPAVALLHHLLHVQKMARVGAQVVLYALLVANVNHDVVEQTCLAAVAYGDGKTAL